MSGVDDLDDQPVSTVTGDVHLAADDASLSRSLEREKVRRLTQANDLREWFFRLASTLAGATVLTSVVMVAVVLFGVRLQSSVAIAFISGLAVETVGVLGIMAGYLFPRERGAE